MQWFIDAAKPVPGSGSKVVAQSLTPHDYESKVGAPAFTAITGIKVTHDIIQEGDVVEKIQTQMQTGQNLYDGWVNDSDLIGTHWRYQQVRNLTDFMANEGKDVTNPGLDLDDFIGSKFTTAPDKKLYQLPDQQFANLYWFRYDWFNDEKNKADFKAKYGYDLGVPVNWSAYEDIAAFFTGREIDGKKVYGHMDYGKKDPSLGWRFTDAWLSMAGNGDRGLPNGLPVDEWGIKVDDQSRPVGSCVARGGDTNGPASVYAIQKYLDWIKAYAPAEAQGMTFSESGPVPSQGNIAQQIFWYTAFTADMAKPGLPVVNEDGTPKWRVAPSPHGVYWKDGMKLGYQDVGSWTLMKSTPDDRAKAAWLYAQFVTSKTVDVKKSHVGLTFIRDSTIHHQSFTAVWSSSIVLRPAYNGRRPAPTYLTTPSWLSCGGRPSAMRLPAQRRHRKRWIPFAPNRKKSSHVWSAPGFRVTSDRSSPRNMTSSSGTTMPFPRAISLRS